MQTRRLLTKYGHVLMRCFICSGWRLPLGSVCAACAVSAMARNRVKMLLTETDLSLAQIAEKAGFEHVEYLSVVFKKEIGLPPSQYRAQHRRGPRG